jgi:hypothetical protein
MSETNTVATTPRWEYDKVLQLSADAEALLRVHGMPLTKDEAKAVLDWAVAIRPRPSKEKPLRLFFRGKRGKYSLTKGYISLPAAAPRLRVGIVLHEYAHHLERKRKDTVSESLMEVKGKDPHGKDFVRVLDELVSLFLAGAAAERNAPAAASFELRTYKKRGRCLGCKMATTRRTESGEPGCKKCFPASVDMEGEE